MAIYTRRDPHDIRTIAMDSSSRTSVALETVMLRRRFGTRSYQQMLQPAIDLAENGFPVSEMMQASTVPCVSWRPSQ